MAPKKLSSVFKKIYTNVEFIFSLASVAVTRESYRK